jgi:hypothetical protein
MLVPVWPRFFVGVPAWTNFLSKEAKDPMRQTWIPGTRSKARTFSPQDAASPGCQIEAMSSPEDHAPHLPATKARQGSWGRPLFWVLTSSLTLAILALVGAWVWHSEQLTTVQHNARAPASEVARFYGPPPQPKSTPAPPSPG